MLQTYQNILVLGAGESGTGAALLAKKQQLDVFVSEYGTIKNNYRKILLENHIDFEENGHSPNKFKNIDLVIASPGIADTAPVFSLIDKSVPIISEIEFASHFTKSHIIAISGSNGKTTTANLLGHIFKDAGLDSCVAGNIGNSFAAELAIADHDYFILELSSFQLDRIQSFKPNTAILTNITADHLDRYNNDMELYAASKMRITKNQDENDAFIYCADDFETVKQLKKHNIKARKYPFSIHAHDFTEAAYLQENKIHIKISNTHFSMTIEELALQGKHNIYNSLAAGMASRLTQIRKESLKASLSNYKNVEHRLEYVANVHGAAYYNDSKATNINATWYALESFDNPIIWIAGGVDKGNDYSLLLPLVRQKVKAIICIGKDNKAIHNAFGNTVEQFYEADSIENAVAMASILATKDEVVLLSPACASFDRFENFEERGQKFKKAVRSL